MAIQEINKPHGAFIYDDGVIDKSRHRIQNLLNQSLLIVGGNDNGYGLVPVYSSP